MILPGSQIRCPQNDSFCFLRQPMHCLLSSEVGGVTGSTPRGASPAPTGIRKRNRGRAQAVP
jgi:hypothetical protein